MSKPTDPVLSRQMVALRPPPELRAKLEAAAEQSGRPVSKEAEWRIAESFVRAQDPLPGIFSDELRSVLRSSPPFAHLIETIADAAFHAIHAANGKGRDEIEVRTAARAAINAVMDDHLWRGESDGTPIEPPLASLGARVRDYPPAHLGFEIASQRITWLSTWREADAALDKGDGRISNLYSGDGRTVLMGPSVEDVEEQRERQRVEAKAALARGDVTMESPDRLHLYKQVRQDPPAADEGEAIAPRSLKDIMGR